MNLNKSFILGNVTRDPESRTMPSGQQVVSFGVATNRFYTDTSGQKKQDAEFHNIVCFGKLADIASRYLAKGSLVFIEGRNKTRNWQNQSGVKQYRTEIIAETLQLGPRFQGGPTQKPFSSQGSSQGKTADIPVIEENYAPPEDSTSEGGQKDKPSLNNSDEIDVKDIPF